MMNIFPGKEFHEDFLFECGVGIVIHNVCTMTFLNSSKYGTLFYVYLLSSLLNFTALLNSVCNGHVCQTQVLKLPSPKDVYSLQMP